jgi:hypothetical protein
LFPGKIFEEDEGNTENIDINQRGKRDEKVPMPIMLDVDSDDEDYDNIIDSALDKAPEKDLVDLAGILGEFFIMCLSRSVDFPMVFKTHKNNSNI